MPSRVNALSSSVATKILIGLTGLGLFVYLLVHIAGNLMVFFGRDAFNRYAYTLEGNPLIPAIEIGLLLVFLLHVYKTVPMTFRNRRARPVKYARKQKAGPPSRKSLASSTMIVTGLWLLVFVVIHVKAFRFGAHYESRVAGIADLYRVEMDVFRNPLMVGFYVLSMVIVGSHLWHGVSSGLQSIGVDDARYTPRLLVAGKVAAVLIAVGFIAIALWAHFLGGRS